MVDEGNISPRDADKQKTLFWQAVGKLSWLGEHGLGSAEITDEEAEAMKTYGEVFLKNQDW